MAPPAAQPTPDPGWFHHFEPYGLFHAVAAGSCLLVMVAWCLAGRRLLARSVESERTFRYTIAWTMLAWQAFATVWRLLPSNFDLNESLPLHLCRLVGWAAPFALISQHRRLRSIVFFWGLGLSTQGFVTPMWDFGLASVDFWLYWVGHTMIVGTAVYAIAVHAWGPRFRDWGFAALWGMVYAGLVIPINLWLGTNYSYLGRGEYAASSVVDALGDWPERPLLMIAGAQALMLALYWCAWGVRAHKRRKRSTWNIATSNGVENPATCHPR
ncbi:MAG: TIGR02206 family membrane protein [Phycisphaerales bacterium JB040]